MPRKLALKRLTASDLTLFRWHFKSSQKGNQKAFNLDSKILVGALYPQMGGASAIPNPRYRLDLQLQGPGHAGEHYLVRKILRQRKNWRLNGEMIDNPDDDPSRYNVLVEGDFALLEFFGSVEPTSLKIGFVAGGVDADSALHAEMARRYPNGSMHLIDEAEVASILTSARLAANHPIHEWVESDALEDAAIGGAAGIARVATRRAGLGISPEDFMRSRQQAEQTGVCGEELLNGYLEQRLEKKEISDLEWVASVNAVSAFDFCIISGQGEKRLIDAKSTTGRFGNPLHLSWNELVTAVEAAEPYDIYRLFYVTETSAKLRVAENIRTALLEVYETLRTLPAGVTPDAISIRPELLPFSEHEIVVGLPDEGEVT